MWQSVISCIGRDGDTFSSSELRSVSGCVVSFDTGFVVVGGVVSGLLLDG